MKLSSNIFLFLLAASQAFSETIKWETRMIQIQLGGAISIPQIVANQGSKPSLPIGPNGSRFELWGRKYLDETLSSEDLLSTAEVGTYSPECAITMSTADPFADFHRTQVGQPFTVTFDTSHLIASGPGVPLASTKLLVEHYTDLYTQNSYDGSSVEESKLYHSFFIEANGPTSFTYPVTNIKAPDMARRSGRERFIVYALADGDVPQRIITKDEITVFPRTEGNIVGLDDETKIYRSLPEFSANVFRAYPNDSTWIEVCEGPYYEGIRGTKLKETFENTHNTPQDSTLKLEEYNPEVQPKKSGQVTLVLRTSTPFTGETLKDGGIPLDYKTITVVTSISVNGMLGTIE